MRRINLFSYGMMSLLKLFARVLVIVLAVSLFQQAHSAQAVPVRSAGTSTAAQCPRPLPRGLQLSQGRRRKPGARLALLRAGIPQLYGKCVSGGRLHHDRLRAAARPRLPAR